MTSILIRRASPLAAFLLSSALVCAPLAASAEQVNADPSALVAADQLQDDWNAAAQAVKAATTALQDQMTLQATIESDIAAQTARIEEGKAGLNAAVLKVADAKARLKAVSTASPDETGATLAEARDAAEATLNDILAEAESAQDDITRLSAEREGAKATVAEMEKAVSAAKAAASAANLVVEAVKSAQLTIAANNPDGTDGDGGGLENDFFTEAMQQAEATQKSAVVAQKALDLTVEREAIIAAKLKDAEDRLSAARKGEKSALAAFSEARDAYDAHAKSRAAQEAEREAKLAAVTEELTALEEQMQAQASLLQKDTEALQQLTARQADMQSTTDALAAELATAKTVFQAVDNDLRTAQRTRSMQVAAVMAGANAEMKRSLRTALASDVGAGSRVTIPADQLFRKRSAKLTPAEGLDLGALAAAAMAATSDLPGDVEWILRVDSHAPGKGDEAWFLAQARAMAVVQSLIKTTGVSVARISANGFAGAEGDGFVELVLTAR